MWFPRVAGISYRRDRVVQDNKFYTVIEVIVEDIAKLEFIPHINEDPHVKLANVGQLRLLKALARGVKHPVVILWDGYRHDEVNPNWADQLTRESVAGANTVYVSKNGYINYHLRRIARTHNYVIHNHTMAVKEIKSQDDAIAQQILVELQLSGRIKVFQIGEASMTEIYENLDPLSDLAGVSEIGFPSRYSVVNNYPVAFNTSYFLYEVNDYISDFSLLGDPYNLQIQGGAIKTAPIYKRSALLVDKLGKATVKQVSLENVIMECLGKSWNLSTFALNRQARFSLYTRYFRAKEEDRTSDCSPLNPENVDFVIINQSIVGFKQGGGLEIPQNGFVFSIPLTECSIQDIQSFGVKYTLDLGEFQTAVQCGPGLIADGQIVLDDGRLRKEEFFQRRYQGKELVDIGVVPTDYAPDINKTKAARMAVGVDRQGRVRVLAVESVNEGMAEPWGESSGVSLQELTQLAWDRGFIQALNVDGGGSTNLQYLGGSLIRTADRRGLPGVIYERMVPSIGVIKA